MILTVFAPQHATWRRMAFDMRERRGIALATIQTFLGTKGLTSGEVTAITAGLTA